MQFTPVLKNGEGDALTISAGSVQPCDATRFGDKALVIVDIGPFQLAEAADSLVFELPRLFNGIAGSAACPCILNIGSPLLSEPGILEADEGATSLMILRTCPVVDGVVASPGGTTEFPAGTDIQIAGQIWFSVGDGQ